MCVCVCVCVCMCLCVYMYVYMYVMEKRGHVSDFHALFESCNINPHVYTYLHIYACICIHTYIHACISKTQSGYTNLRQ